MNSWKKIQENPLTFNWSIVLSKSDIREPQNTLFFSSGKIMCIYKNVLCANWPQCHIKMFKLSFCGSDKNPIFFFLNLWQDLKVCCADLSWLLVFKDGLKKCSSFKKISHFDGQNGQKLGLPKPLFCIKDKKNLNIPNLGHIWAYIHANSHDFWKSLNRSDNTKHVKNCGKKCKKNHFLNPFLGHFQKSETGSVKNVMEENGREGDQLRFGVLINIQKLTQYSRVHFFFIEGQI